jgi:ABC-type oligopeptide transport system ATPase subunit
VSDTAQPLLEIERLTVEFHARRDRGHVQRTVRAVDDVSLTVHSGETLGIVGESGCGKTTLIRCAAKLLDAKSGSVSFEGTDITSASRRGLRDVRKRMQLVFQDSEAALNPRKRVRQILATPLRLRGVARGQLAHETQTLLQEVGLRPEHGRRFPHELSGGQRQRVGIARALALQPRLLLLDEPVSALDVSVRAQIVNLLADLRERHRLSCVFVAHDLAIVRHVSDRIAVMHAGQVVEVGDAEQVCSAPEHPRTKALLAAIPPPDPLIARQQLAANAVSVDASDGRDGGDGGDGGDTPD